MGSKEEKHIVIEFQKKILQEAGCSAEVIAFLDEIEDEVFCEYYCFCFLDGMPIEEVRRIRSNVSEKNGRVILKDYLCQMHR